MLQRLLGHTTLMMTNRYCQAVGCYDAIESHIRGIVRWTICVRRNQLQVPSKSAPYIRFSPSF